MKDDGDKKAGPPPILAEDTPSEWDDPEPSVEGLTEFEFSPPSAKKRRTSSNLSNPSNVGALLDRVIDELAPPADPLATAEMDELPRLPLPTTAEVLPNTAPAAPIIDDTKPNATGASLAELESAPPAEAPPPRAPPPRAPPPPAPPPPAPPPYGVPSSPMINVDTPKPGLPQPRAQPAPGPTEPPPPGPPSVVMPDDAMDPRGASLAELSFPKQAESALPSFPAPAHVGARPPPSASSEDAADSKATAEMRKPLLEQRPTPKRPPPQPPPAPPPVDSPQPPERTPVPVNRDVGTEMFDGQAAAIDHMVKASLDERGDSSIRVPEALSDEVRAVSKVLMGRRDGSSDTPLPSDTPMPGFDARALTADLALDAQGRARPKSPPAPIPPPLGAGESSGGELDAVADAFTVEPSDPNAESILELAYEPAKARRVPPRPDASFLEDVTPKGMTIGTKILIAVGVVLALIVIGVVVK